MTRPDRGGTGLPVRTEPVPEWMQRSADWVALVVVLAGLWSLAAIPLQLFPAWVATGNAVFSVLNLPTGPSLYVAAFMTVIGGALVSRKRVALWFVAIYFQLGSLLVATLTLVAGTTGWVSRPSSVLLDSRLDDVLFGAQAAVAVLTVGLLWRIRRAFPARIDKGATTRALEVLISGLAVSAGIAVLLTELAPNTLQGQTRKVGWAIRTALGFIPEHEDKYFRGAGHPWIVTVIGLFSAIALLAALSVFLRAARRTQHLVPADELEVRRLLGQAAEPDSLGYFATRRDKSVVFSPDRSAAVSYRVVLGASLASGDPLGAPAAWPAAVDAWLTEARAHGWIPAVLAASELGATVYERAGLRVLSLGDEAVLEAADFALAAPRLQPVRQAAERLAKAGYRVDLRRHGDISPAELEELQACAERWRGKEPERGFSMALGRLGDPCDERCVMLTARDTEGRVRTLLSFVPWGRDGLSLDLMRRDPESPNGIVEFSVAELMERCRDLGVRRVSLNFAMFREILNAGERIGAGPVARLAHGALVVASRWWQIESLYRSNAKFQPRWSPRFVCYRSGVHLTRVLISAGSAEGFLPGPRPVDLHEGPEALVALAERVHDLDEELIAVARPVRPLTRHEAVRHRKREAMIDAGVDPYPPFVPRTHHVIDVVDKHGHLGPDERSGERVSVVGRVVRRRDHGGVCFADLSEEGVEVQVMLSRRAVGDEALARWRRTVDLGDHVSVTGEIVASHRGELSIAVEQWTMAAKCLRPLPDKYRGLGGELRRQDRHLQLIVGDDLRRMLQLRAQVLAGLRQALAGRGFVEIESPMLHVVHGGANARPFSTHLNAFGLDVSLRIAPELYLKRLCVGGMPRIYELNRNFRNEGIDATHHPEFTSLEVYAAHTDYTAMAELAHQLVVAAATAVNETPGLHLDEARLAAVLTPWPTVPVHEAVGRAVGVPITTATPLAPLLELCRAHHVSPPARATAGEVVVALYEALVEPATTSPTFYCDFPVETSPLAKRHRTDPSLAERWDLVVGGLELGTGYSELNDPVDQRDRLVTQSIAAAHGDPEAMQIDEDFLAALETAMPPTGGLGLGVDRLIMVLTGAAIHDTLAFPLSRPGSLR